MSEWQDPWLLHRLRPPSREPAVDARVARAFSFGHTGGGGFSLAALEALGSAFRFDYMGDAEYELGSAPRALHEIATLRGAYGWTTVTLGPGDVVPPARVAADLRRKRSDKARRKVVEAGRSVEIHVLVKRDLLAEAAQATLEAATGHYEPKHRIEHDVGALAFPLPGEPPRVIGWLDSKNASLWIADDAVADAVAASFGVPREPLAAVPGGA